MQICITLAFVALDLIISALHYCVIFSLVAKTMRITVPCSFCKVATPLEKSRLSEMSPNSHRMSPISHRRDNIYHFIRLDYQQLKSF